MSSLIIACGIVVTGGTVTRSAEAHIPFIYSTDLLHPHDDPDDHYDLATLFALPELDVRGIVLDQGDRQAQRCGKPALAQIMQITGRSVPWAVGLSRPLQHRLDEARDQPDAFQGGVELMLSILRRSSEPVVVFTTGSCRDVAVAYNREPALLRQKIRALYINIGRGPNEVQNEWNVGLDRFAYLRLFETSLPLFWCPCFGTNGYQTLFVADQAQVVGACQPAVQNYFVYCLAKANAEPLEFLKSGSYPVPSGSRNMWCTAPLIHAAGRSIYRPTADKHIALTPDQARARSLMDRMVTAFHFVSMRAELHGGSNDPMVLLDTREPNARVFRAIHPDYSNIMANCLRNLLAELGRAKGQ